MKQIINYLLLKCLKIFLPFFFIVLAMAIGVAPIFLAICYFNGYIFLGLTISIPLGIVIIVLVNRLTNWEELWNFDEFPEMIDDYKYERQLLAKNKLEANNTIYDNCPGETMYDEAHAAGKCTNEQHPDFK